MRRMIATSVGLAGILTASILPLSGAAQAATASDLSIQPLGPRTAKVCWTAYQPDNPRTVDHYSITSTPGSSTPPVDQGSRCATFDDLNSSRIYDFTVSATLDDASTVTAGTLRAYGPVVRMSARPKVITPGRRSVLSGTVTTRTGIGVSGVAVKVQAKRVDGAWRNLPGTVTTGAKGAWSRKVRPPVNFKYRALVLGASFNGKPSFGGWSSQVDVDVRPVISLSFSRNPVRVGNRVRVTGKVTAGKVALMAGDPVSLQRREGRRWHIIRSTDVRPDGTFGIRLEVTSTRDYTYRWEYRGGREFVTAHSAAKVLRAL